MQVVFSPKNLPLLVSAVLLKVKKSTESIYLVEWATMDF